MARFSGMWRGGWRRAAVLMAGIVLAAAAVRALALAGRPLLDRVGPGCLFRYATGCHCPGCGGTRAFYHFLHGEIAASWRMNPLFLTGLGLGVAALALRLARRPDPDGGPGSAGFQVRSWMGWLALGGIIGFGVLRNLPWWPFTLLAPH